MSSYRLDDRFVELLGLALSLEGTPADRLRSVLEFVRLRVLDDAAAVILAQNQLDFQTKKIISGLFVEVVRSDAEAKKLRALREPDFRNRFDQAFSVIASQVVQGEAKPVCGWMCESLARAGVDTSRWQSEILRGAGLEDLWGATAYFGDGHFVSVIVPQPQGVARPAAHQLRFIEKLPHVLAPIATSPGVASPRLLKDDALSEAQSRVLSYALTGLTEKEIAQRLHRSPHTVNSHLRAIYRRFNVSSRAELLALALDGELGVDGPP